MSDGILSWILEPDTIQGRLDRIYKFLENEGYDLPGGPKGVDYSERDQVKNNLGRLWSVKYSTRDKAGRKVYHFLEREVNHIMISRIEHGQSWAISYLGDIAEILRTGREYPAPGKVSYIGRKRYKDPDTGKEYRAQVIIKEYQDTWYIDTFFMV